MLKSFLEVWEKLTLTKLLLGVLGAFSYILLHWVWEQRNAVFITLTGSPFSLLVIGAVVILVVMAWVAAMFVGMSEQRTSLVIAAMRDRISAAEAVCAGQAREIERLHRVIDEAVRDERAECEARIQQLVDVLGVHGIKDRRINSKMGELG